MLSALLLALIVLVPGAVSAPPSRDRYETRIARRVAGLPRANQRVERDNPSASNISHISYTSNWVGAGYTSLANTWKSVTATIVLPKLSGSVGDASSAWVGIDGSSCENAILQTGVDFTVNSGSTSYDAWYEWYPDYAYEFSGITLATGDSVTLTVTATSTTTGTAVITNNTTGKTVTHTFSSSYALCEQDAEWIVQDFSTSLAPAYNTLTFSGAVAQTSSGLVGPGSATIYKPSEPGSDQVTLTGTSVTVKYY